MHLILSVYYFNVLKCAPGWGQPMRSPHEIKWNQSAFESEIVSVL